MLEMLKKNMLSIFVSISIILIVFIGHAHAVRIKDIADIKGVRNNQLVGYGLVIGLNGTGDSQKSEFTFRSMASMLEKMNVTIDAEDINVDNVAAVMVTSNLPPFARVGSKIDVLVSSIGDAENLQGGTLLFTPLKAADGKIYAVAGVFPLWEGCGEAWAIPTVRIKERRISIARHFKRTLDLAFEDLKMRRVQAAVKVGHDEAHRLARFVGMEEEGLMKRYGPEGADYMRYATWPIQ